MASTHVPLLDGIYPWQSSESSTTPKAPNPTPLGQFRLGFGESQFLTLVGLHTGATREAVASVHGVKV